MQTHDAELSVLDQDQKGSTEPHNESVAKTFWRYTIPAVAAMMVNGLYQVVDGVFVGHFIGSDGLAAVNIAWPVVGLIAGLGTLVGIGAGSLLSLFRGAKDAVQAQAVLTTSVWLLLILAATTSLALYASGTLLLDLQGASGDVLRFGHSYLSVFGWGALATMAAGALPMLIRNDGSPGVATRLLIFGALTNIVLDYVFIVLLQWQLAGAAWASVVSQSLVAVLALSYFCSAKAGIKLTAASLRFSLNLAGRTLVQGASGLVMFLYFAFITALHNKQLLMYGEPLHVAAFALIGYIGVIYYFFAEGVASGMQPPISYYYGAKQIEKISATLKLACQVSLSVGLVIVLCLNLFPEFIVSLFSQESALLNEAQKGARLHLSMVFLDGFIFLAAMYYVALDQGAKSLLISLGNMAIQVPFLFFLPEYLGVDGVWLSVPVSNLVLTLIVAPMLWRDVSRLRHGRALSQSLH
ncbi:multidrug efflux protein [Pseudoalteromonas rubra]|uniref:Multidrug export protein MepA n=1 Tax=Pseudoalteromonas rubra TaxID=43658 RepID=A0A5S3WK86_9GAMM|nr:MATE family efflux transporter [Pseudoalteromonas rubra]TMP27583.1 multidrug efflux protein [Pseudoalteromonas rubra]TMP28934.1 multidrug efflux protein [Pseudoalteromonas rubra]